MKATQLGLDCCGRLTDSTVARVLFGLTRRAPGARQELISACGRPVSGDLVDDVRGVLLGIDACERALEHQAEQDGEASPGLDTADQQAVLPEHGNGAD